MIAVFDNFIEDQDLLNEINNNFADLFKDPGKYKWYDGWWNTEANTTIKKIIKHTWSDNCPLNLTLSIAGFEYWTGIQSASHTDAFWKDGLAAHLDKDEEALDKAGEWQVPILGCVYYPEGQNFVGGDLHIYTSGLDNSPEVVKAKPNRLVVFDAGYDYHGVSTVTDGVRHAIAFNLWQEAPYSKQNGVLTIE